ncbi:endo-1,4-beta-xylanase [Paenibacillus sp. SYP-B4298]|uniref:endo-1,4-beta-xylanase n=1 Tax=Paenibacillus sp. SYP-B4298 TaxID=2996034 RepID=UPI0022DE6E2D|nr:endo-1,4-beta-xylanase [Paenibacillus sp. SYP-B4298]
MLKLVKKMSLSFLALSLIGSSLAFSAFGEATESETAAVAAEAKTAYVYDFEDGTTQGWASRIGKETVAASDALAHAGNYSLYTEGRTENYSGPSLDVKGKLQPKTLYSVSAWVRLGAEQPDTSLRISLQRTLAGETNYDTIAPNTLVTAGSWVKLSGNYELTNEADALSLYVESDQGLASFYVDDVELKAVNDTEVPSLAGTYKDLFTFGVAIEALQTEGAYGELVKKHFNSIVAENSMKPGSLSPSEGKWNWEPADKLIAFAKKNNMDVRFHTLAWHSQAAEWMFKDSNNNPLAATPENKKLVLERLTNYIHAVVERYKDDITDWDVVNEVIDPGQPDGLRRSEWYRLTGTDFIETAFIETRKAAGDKARLYINDYNTDQPAKRDHLYNLVKSMLDKGVPIDGVGHQTHVNIVHPSLDSIRASIEKFASLGLDNQITELDVSVYTNDRDVYETVPEDILIVQAYRYKELFELFRELGDKISNVTVWGTDDSRTWLNTYPTVRPNPALLFDRELQPKYAYWALIDPSRVPYQAKEAGVRQGTVSLQPTPSTLWNGTGALSLSGSTDEYGADVKLLWDNTKLYVHVDVSDTKAGEGDRIDLFVGGKQYTFPATADESQAADSVRTPRSGGYTLQAAVPHELANPAIGGQLTFDVRVTSASREQSLSWNNPYHKQEQQPDQLGKLKLEHPAKLTQVTKGTPVIDGQVDAIWNAATSVTTDTWVIGSSGATAKVRLLWDEGHLYVLADVKDSKLSKASANVWEQDSIELFIDRNNAKTTIYQQDDGQYRINYDNQQSFGGSASAATLKSATTLTSDGYRVEAAIALDTLRAAPGTYLGFDAQVNDDSTGTGARSGVVTWTDPTGNSYQNTSGFGTLQLVSAEPQQPAPYYPSASTVSVPSSQPALPEQSLAVTASQLEGSGSAVIKLKDNERYAVLPANAAELLGSRSLVLHKGGYEWTFPATVLAPAGKAAGEQGRILIQLDWKSIDSAAVGNNGLIPASGQVTVQLIALNSKGEQLPLTELADPVTVALQTQQLPAERVLERIALYSWDSEKQTWKRVQQASPAITPAAAKLAALGTYAFLESNPSFPDLKDQHWAAPAAKTMAAWGLVNLSSTGQLEPDALVTRGELALLLAQALTLPAAPVASLPFGDVPSDASLRDAISAVSASGLMVGSNGQFGTDSQLTREQLASVLVRAYSYKMGLTVSSSPATAYAESLDALSKMFTKDAASISPWAAQAVYDAVSYELLRGTGGGAFQPGAEVTRKELLQAVYNLLLAVNRV